MVQKDNGNGTFTVYTYDGDNRHPKHHQLCPIAAARYVPANHAVNSFDTYTYDALGNVLTDTNQDGKWVYTYDADSQLIHAVFTPNATNPDGLAARTCNTSTTPPAIASPRLSTGW